MIESNLEAGSQNIPDDLSQSEIRCFHNRQVHRLENHGADVERRP